VIAVLRIKNQQKVFDIGGVKVGGLPGERPTLLIGSIFYKQQRIVEDEFEGRFNRSKAEELISIQEEFSARTGNPCMLDVVGASSKAIIKFLDFAADVSHSPLLLDGISADVRMDAVRFADEVGLSKRIVYNTISPEHRKEELEALEKSNIRTVVVLAYYPKDFTARGRLRAVKELVPKLQEKGIENILVDTCVLDIPSLGSACKAICAVKDELGYPSGCGAHNAIETWRGLRKKMGEKAKNPSTSTAVTLPVAFGADFILYGPIEQASYIFPAVALVDAAYAQLIIEEGRRPSSGHPIFKIA